MTIDLRSGYYHIALGKDSRAKAAFVMPFGKYKFLQVPFGLAQAPAFFQHLMNKVLDNCPFAMTYLDDIIIFSDMGVEGPPSSRLQSKTNKNNLTDQQDHQDPPECNRIPVDLLMQSKRLIRYKLLQQPVTGCR